MTVVLTSMLSVMQRYFLSLVEAMIEKGGYPQAEITGYINEVRARVGMPAVEVVEGTNLNKEELRAIVRHERRVELAFEDLRFADLTVGENLKMLKSVCRKTSHSMALE